MGKVNPRQKTQTMTLNYNIITLKIFLKAMPFLFSKSALMFTVLNITFMKLLFHQNTATLILSLHLH